MICWTLKCQDIGTDRLISVLCDEHWELANFNLKGMEKEMDTDQMTGTLPAPLPAPIADTRFNKLPPGISRCLLVGGYHAYMEEPCFYLESEAVAYKADLDTGRVQSRGWRRILKWRNS